MTPDFDEGYDWVVVGNGAGSMSSALVMRAAGRSVLILEKSPWAGGTTAKSGGVIWVPNNRFMKQAGIHDSAEAGIAYLDALCGDSPDTPGTSPEKRRAYVVEAAKMIEFLVAQGVELERASDYWPDYYDELPGGCKTSRCIAARLFDTNALGAWRDKLRPGFLPVPAKLDEAMKLPYYKKSWLGRGIFLKVALRTAWARLTGRRIVSAGAALQGRMLLAALKAGVDIRLDSPVSELVVEEGRVTGIVTTKDGKPWRIAARLGVLVNAGGFARNQAMRDQYMPGTTRAEWSQVNESDTGDMHVEMERIGGVLAQMDQMVGYQCTLTPGWEKMSPVPPAQSLTGKPHAILVDQSGVRYMNEGGSYELYCETMLARNRAIPAIPSWAIFDTDYIDQYMLAGTMPGRSKPKQWTEQGYLKQAGSVADLATVIDVDPATLEATVARWNGFVDRGVDEDFHRGEREYDLWLGDPHHRPNPALGRIARAPFYAVNVIPGDVSTYGGVLTDVHGRVVRADGAPIEGLYATGVSTASVMGGVYPGAGASIGPSLTFGYIAAKHAAGLGDGQGPPSIL